MIDRLTRRFIGLVLPRPGLFHGMLIAGSLARPFRALMPKRLRTMLDLLPARPAVAGLGRPGGGFPADGAGQGASRPPRVAMLSGCAQQVLGPQVNEATVRLLNPARRRGRRHPSGRLLRRPGASHGQDRSQHAQARAMIDAWIAEADGGRLDAIVINASGCGTTVKDYGHMFRGDPAYAEKASRVAALAKDITEFLAGLDMSAVRAPAEIAVTYHSACSMQHGQQIKAAPVDLLRNAGFAVKEPAEGHLCCGSAGTYNMLQPDLAGRLKARKIANLRQTRPDAIATGNIGCMMQLAGDAGAPVVHTVELLDWAAGGPKPAGLG